MRRRVGVSVVGKCTLDHDWTVCVRVGSMHIQCCRLARSRAVVRRRGKQKRVSPTILDHEASILDPDKKS